MRGVRASLLQSCTPRNTLPSRQQCRLLRPSTLACSSTRSLSVTTNTRQLSHSPSALFDESTTSPSKPQTPSSTQNYHNAPPPSAAAKSAKLAALHARLSLPARFPILTLARCLVDVSADKRPAYNNTSLALIGQDLLGHMTAEWLICNYPRLPMDIILAAQSGYIGSKTLDHMRKEWGVELAAAPGQEVDPGLLQFTRALPGNAMSPDGFTRNKNAVDGYGVKPEKKFVLYRGMAARIVTHDMFGENPLTRKSKSGVVAPEAAYHDANSPAPLDAVGASTAEDASATFVRALFGALYLHAGVQAAKSFHASHVLSRHLPLHTLFAFKYPTRDLSKLCLREGFQSPVARLLSETGRHSRSPVFIVGVFSGEDKLGEGEGASLDEARVRACANAMRSWYLYTPPAGDVVLPSDVEGTNPQKKWKAQMVDPGEILT